MPLGSKLATRTGKGHHYKPKAYNKNNMKKSSSLKLQGLKPVYLLCSNVLPEKHKQIFYVETTRTKACVFSMYQCLMVHYIHPAIHTPEVQIGYISVVISIHRITIGK